MRDTGAPNPRPIFIHGGIAKSTDFQIQDYLLCSDCEELFNKNGECWVINNCYQPDGDFPIRTALINSVPFGTRPKLLVYAAAQIPAINREQITYFAASIFWRAAAHSWPVGSKAECFNLELGPYLEPLRLFLKGESQFPEHMALLVTVSTSQKLIQFFTLPVSANKQGFRVHEFTFSGLSFSLFTGGLVSVKEYGMCFSRSLEGFISIAPELEIHRLKGVAKTIDKSKVVGELAHR